MRLVYHFDTWRGWDKHVRHCAADFQANTKLQPDLLAVSPSTRRRLNIAASGANAEHRVLQAFKTDKFHLTIVTENDMPDGDFAIINVATCIDDLPAD